MSGDTRPVPRARSGRGTARDRDVRHGEPGPGGERRPTGLAARLRRLFSSDEELEARELQESTEELGATPVRQCGDRRRVCVAGTVKTVTLEPRAGAPTLEAELYDGSDMLTLVWLGRRRIQGIEPGRRLRVHGLIATAPTGRRTMYNPRYELIAATR